MFPDAVGESGWRALPLFRVAAFKQCKSMSQSFALLRMIAMSCWDCFASCMCVKLGMRALGCRGYLACNRVGNEAELE